MAAAPIPARPPPLPTPVPLPAAAMAMPPPAAASAAGEKKKDKNKVAGVKKVKLGVPGNRIAAGLVWDDKTIEEWPENDFRIFVGDLGNEVSDDGLARAFGKYASLAKARVVRDKRTGKSKGFGFVSLLDSKDFLNAMREMNGKYIGNRPCKLRKSTWEERSVDHLAQDGKRLFVAKGRPAP